MFDLLTTLRYGDSLALKDFTFAHRLAHAESASAIATQFSASMPDFDIGDERAREEWDLLMQGEEPPPGVRLALRDWLQLHQRLHQAEFDAVGFGVAPDLSTVDFASERQFAQWMLDHQQIHEQVASALRVTT